MARFDTEGLQQVIDDMRRMGEQSGEAAKALLMIGAEQVRIAWQQAAEKHGHKDTGALIRSIGYPRQPKQLGDILSIDIYPVGKDAKGVRNAEKAFILHYGTSKYPGSRWVDTADRISDALVTPAMTEAWERYLETGQLPNVSGLGGAGSAGGGITKTTN